MLCTSVRSGAEVIKKLGEVIADFHTWLEDQREMVLQIKVSYSHKLQLENQKGIEDKLPVFVEAVKSTELKLKKEDERRKLNVL